jgi:hypothetical protein
LEPGPPASVEPSPPASPDGKPATFWIDPSTLPLDRTASTITGFINEIQCASGQPPDGRVLEPVVIYESDAITITFYVTPRPGDQDCPGNPDHPVTVTLDEAIGDRSILDGSASPPRDATTPPS